MDALRSHGYTSEALRLAVSIVRTLKQGQLQSQQRWEDQQSRLLVNCTGSAVARNSALVPSSAEGWIGHPLDPIGCLFDTLAEASLVPDDQNRNQYYIGTILFSFFAFLLFFLQEKSCKKVEKSSKSSIQIDEIRL